MRAAAAAATVAGPGGGGGGDGPAASTTTTDVPARPAHTSGILHSRRARRRPRWPTHRPSGPVLRRRDIPPQPPRQPFAVRPHRRYQDLWRRYPRPALALAARLWYAGRHFLAASDCHRDAAMVACLRIPGATRVERQAQVAGVLLQLRLEGCVGTLMGAGVVVKGVSERVRKRCVVSELLTNASTLLVDGTFFRGGRGGVLRACRRGGDAREEGRRGGGGGGGGGIPAPTGGGVGHALEGAGGERGGSGGRARRQGSLSRRARRLAIPPFPLLWRSCLGSDADAFLSLPPLPSTLLPQNPSAASTRPPPFPSCGCSAPSPTNGAPSSLPFNSSPFRCSPSTTMSCSCTPGASYILGLRWGRYRILRRSACPARRGTSRAIGFCGCSPTPPWADRSR